MTSLLKKAFTEASRLSKQEQDSLGTWILEELAAERRWGKAFADSADILIQLADEALVEYHERRTHH
jgi:hypothetical protein